VTAKYAARCLSKQVWNSVGMSIERELTGAFMMLPFSWLFACPPSEITRARV
jgi:hypothetical protein